MQPFVRVPYLGDPIYLAHTSKAVNGSFMLVRSAVLVRRAQPWSSLWQYGLTRGLQLREQRPWHDTVSRRLHGNNMSRTAVQRIEEDRRANWVSWVQWVQWVCCRRKRRSFYGRSSIRCDGGEWEGAICKVSQAIDFSTTRAWSFGRQSAAVRKKQAGLGAANGSQPWLRL